MPVKTYEIRVNGSLHMLTAEKVEGLTITTLGERDSVLTAQLVDQPALHGLLDRIHAAGLVLISVRFLEDSSSGTGQE